MLEIFAKPNQYGGIKHNILIHNKALILTINSTNKKNNYIVDLKLYGLLGYNKLYSFVVDGEKDEVIWESLDKAYLYTEGTKYSQYFSQSRRDFLKIKIPGMIENYYKKFIDKK